MCAFYFFWLSASHDLRLGMDGMLLALCDHGFERSGKCVVNNNNNNSPFLVQGTRGNRQCREIRGGDTSIVVVLRSPREYGKIIYCLGGTSEAHCLTNQKGISILNNANEDQA